MTESRDVPADALSRDRRPEPQLGEEQSSEQGQACPVLHPPTPQLPHPTMGSRLLCCVALCLLGAGSADSEVTQTPSHLVKARGQTASLTCSFFSGTLTVSWYQQALGQGPEFLVQYYRGEERVKGKLPARFSVEPRSNSSSKLNMRSLEPRDSAVYLCTSSIDTAPQSHRHPVHKAPCAGSGRGRGGGSCQPDRLRPEDSACLPRTHCRSQVRCVLMLTEIMRHECYVTHRCAEVSHFTTGRAGNHTQGCSPHGGRHPAPAPSPRQASTVRVQTSRPGKVAPPL
ncbi:uncharacterized protein LOC118610759 [Rousettus aegyptiacus]|uniref:uncharacterized protein LOC118610759 n=1 Tax=Rousettus aegyptiacus TaxID=9407 RepID=UPI00168D2A18|nr:uncharacterized protein LOC118610759 [Rousettus aegyptiacus]